jgi:cytochrome c556
MVSGDFVMACLPRCPWFMALGGLLIGCAPAAPPAAVPVRQAASDHDHDHGHDHADHDEPETVAAGLTQLKKLCAEVKAHLAAGDHEKADGPVHMVGHLLEELGELVAKEKPAAEAEAKQALEAIFESFDKLDTVIHGADEEARKKLDYAEHAPAIEAALAKLEELTK